jgi:hypothetical protein
LIAPYLTPNSRDRQQRGDDGPALDHPVQEEGEPESQQQLGDQRRHDDDDGVPDGFHEPPVAEEGLGIVPQSHELVTGAHREIVISQRQVERVHEREHDHEGDQEQRRGGEGERLPLLALQGDRGQPHGPSSPGAQRQAPENVP